MLPQQTECANATVAICARSWRKRRFRFLAMRRLRGSARAWLRLKVGRSSPPGRSVVALLGVDPYRLPARDTGSVCRDACDASRHRRRRDPFVDDLATFALAWRGSEETSPRKDDRPNRPNLRGPTARTGLAWKHERRKVQRPFYGHGKPTLPRSEHAPKEKAPRQPTPNPPRFRETGPALTERPVLEALGLVLLGGVRQPPLGLAGDLLLHPRGDAGGEHAGRDLDALPDHGARRDERA